MSDVEKTNRILEELGSEMRVRSGSIISDAITEVISLLPSYIDRKIDERLSLRPNAPNKTGE